MADALIMRCVACVMRSADQIGAKTQKTTLWSENFLSVLITRAK